MAGLNVEKTMEKHCDDVIAIHQNDDSCVDCAIKRLHHGSKIHFIHSIAKNLFKDDEGVSYDVTYLNENQEPHPNNGIVCQYCLSELIDPIDDREWVSDEQLTKEAPELRRRCLAALRYNGVYDEIALWCVKFNDTGEYKRILDYIVMPEENDNEEDNSEN